MVFAPTFMSLKAQRQMMPEIGDTAPTFNATVGTSDHEPFDLEDHLGDGPVVLAFFPGAFTPPCTNEMVALQEHSDAFAEAGATLLGISADSPFSQGSFREEHGIEFDLISDMSGDAISAYGLEMDIPDLGLHGIANRAVFVLDSEGTVTYKWVADDPTNEPDYEEILDAVESAA
jgi:peroxiredoxin